MDTAPAWPPDEAAEPIFMPSLALRGARSRYIGSKARVSEVILDEIGTPSFESGRFVDLFCGTGSVSKSARQRGWNVHANDHLASSAVATHAHLIDSQNSKFDKLGGYSRVIAHLNSVQAIEGAIFCEYSPSGRSRSGHLRRYFSENNAGRIDGIRSEIEALREQGLLSPTEYNLLLADLLSAANAIANIAGTYGCFLSTWSQSALGTLELRPRELLPTRTISTVSSQDAFAFEDCENDVLYCDPPYTKRQYAAYYHILETIIEGDFPIVDGVAGIREWQHKSSPFCFRRKALDAFTKLIGSKKARIIYFSYSSQGHVGISDLISTLEKCGEVQAKELQTIARYTPNLVSRANGTKVIEYLLKLSR